MQSRTDALAPQPQPNFADVTIAILTGLALAFTAIFIFSAPMSNHAGDRDFVVYWATGQQLVHHANPYDPQAMLQIEHTAGLVEKVEAGLMRNPPYTLPLALPLGFVGVQIAALCWLLLQLGCQAVSIYILWQMFGRPRDCRIWLAIAFAPALLCLIMGQTPIFALLGLVLFLRLHGSHPFLAGVSLWLCALKPHLFLPFGVVLLAWVVVSRSYRILAGAAAALGASFALQYLLDPAAWSQYAYMMHTCGIERQRIPCLGTMLRIWISPQSIWLEFLPAALACVWALAYFRPRRHTWDWMKDGSLLMLVSVFAAPYCWLVDHTVLIPALLYGIYLTRSRWLLLLLAIACLVIEIELACGIEIFSIVYFWTAPAWLAWYLLARASADRPQDQLPPRSANKAIATAL